MKFGWRTTDLKTHYNKVFNMFWKKKKHTGTESVRPKMKQTNKHRIREWYGKFYPEEEWELVDHPDKDSIGTKKWFMHPKSGITLYASYPGPNEHCVSFYTLYEAKLFIDNNIHGPKIHEYEPEKS